MFEDNVFFGPNVTFTNEKYLRSKGCPSEFARTIVKRWTPMGVNTNLLCSIAFGKNAVISAGTIVTKDIPAGEQWFANSTRSHGKAKIIDTEKD